MQSAEDAPTQHVIGPPLVIEEVLPPVHYQLEHAHVRTHPSLELYRTTVTWGHYQRELCGTTIDVDGVADNGLLEGLLAQLLRVAGLSDTRPAVTDLPVSVSEALTLLALRASTGLAQGGLGARLGLEKSTVSRLATGLERKEWITRERDASNQRYVRLALTPEGEAVADHVWSTWQDRHTRILAALTDEERAGLAVGLGGLVRALAAEGLLGPDPSRSRG